MRFMMTSPLESLKVLSKLSVNTDKNKNTDPKNFKKLKIEIVVDLPDNEVHDDFTNSILESVIKTVNTDKN